VAHLEHLEDGSMHRFEVPAVLLSHLATAIGALPCAAQGTEGAAASGGQDGQTHAGEGITR
jgi:hypothetical protein